MEAIIMGWRKTETGGWHYVQTRVSCNKKVEINHVQLDACPECNTLVWTPFTYEQYDMVKAANAVCKNCGHKWVVAIREFDYTWK